MEDTNLAQAVEAADDASSYDTNVYIWICMGNRDDADAIEEIGLDRKTVFGKIINPYPVDLMRGIIIHIRSGEHLVDSQNLLISMLEKLLSQIDAEEKKRILAKEYGMVMTIELEGRIQTMCNLSENIEAKGIEKGIEKGMEKERANAIERMIRAGATKEQIISYGYTAEEYKKVKNLYVNN